MTDYPEHEKLKKVSDESRTVGNFLEWAKQQDLHFGKYEERYHHMGAKEEEFVAVRKSTHDFLAEYFEIDQTKLEEEKRAMLEEIRKGQG